MDDSRRKKLSPASNGAAYPTLKQARRRRALLSGIGAASLAVGVGCFPPFATSGEPPPPPLDASVDAGLFAGGDVGGAGVPDADPVAPDAGADQGGDS